MSKRYHVVREYSHTDKRKLWQILTRPIMKHNSAQVMRDSFRDEYKKKKGKIFIVTMDGDDCEVCKEWFEHDELVSSWDHASVCRPCLKKIHDKKKEMNDDD